MRARWRDERRAVALAAVPCSVPLCGRAGVLLLSVTVGQVAGSAASTVPGLRPSGPPAPVDHTIPCLLMWSFSQNVTQVI